MTAAVALPLRVGARTLASVKRRLVRIRIGLDEGRRGEPPQLAPLPEGADGYLINALPADLLTAVQAQQPRLRTFIRQRYERSYASLEGSFDDYLAGFSGKSRSTLKRKVRKLADVSGGTLDLRSYRSPDEVEEFYRYARAVSAKTYQEKLLDAGLPEGEEALAGMRELAGRDAMRGWVLFLAGQPISYLYAPAEGSTLIYAYLGYDPEHSAISPGTVLQLEAMRELMEEGRFTLFDFTEGEGQHKRQFGTGTLDCVDLLLVRPTLGNLATAHLLNGFDGGIEIAKKLVTKAGLEGLARRLRR